MLPGGVGAQTVSFHLFYHFYHNWPTVLGWVEAIRFSESKATEADYPI